MNSEWKLDENMKNGILFLPTYLLTTPIFKIKSDLTSNKERYLYALKINK